MKENQGKFQKKNLKELIPDAPDDAIDLMEKLFTYDPKIRLTALQVLQHPFLQELYDPKTNNL